MNFRKFLRIINHIGRFQSMKIILNRNNVYSSSILLILHIQMNMSLSPDCSFLKLVNSPHS